MKIGFFGCSFTEGGGFNSPIYVDYAIKNNIIDISELDNKVKIWGNTEREAYEIYGKDYNGPFDSISNSYEFSLGIKLITSDISISIVTSLKCDLISKKRSKISVL